MVKQLPAKLEAWLYKLGTNNSSQIATAVLAGFKMFFIPFASINDKKASPEQRRYAAARDFITEVFAITMYTGVTGLAQKFLTAPLCRRYFAKKAELLERGKINGVSISKDELHILKNVNSKFLNDAGMQEITSFTDKDGMRILKHKASDESLEYIKSLENIIAKLQKNWKELPQDSIFQKIKNAFNTQSKIQNPVDVFKNTRINISQISIWILALSVIPALCNAAIKPLMNRINKNPKKNDNVNFKRKLNMNTPAGLLNQTPKVFSDFKYGRSYPSLNIYNGKAGAV